MRTFFHSRKEYERREDGRVKFWGAENSASALWDFQDAAQADAPSVPLLDSGL